MIQRSGVIYTLLLMTTAGVVGPLKCPSSASDWDRASRGLQCQPPNFYHCLRDESGVNTEQCLPRVWIQPQMCPEFNSRVSRVDVYQCTVNNCPTSLYWSNAVFMYPICFENGSLTSPSKPGSTITTTVMEKTSLFEHHFRSTKASMVLEKTPTFDKSKDSGDESSTDESLPVSTIVGSIIGVVVVCVVGVLIILAYLKRRCRKGNNGGLANGNVNIENEKLSDAVKNENEINEVSELLGNGRSSKLKKESVKDGCQGNESSSKPNESRKDGCQEDQADGNVKSEVSISSDNEGSSDPKESRKNGCQVYVVESQKPNEQTSVPEDKNSILVLVLVLNNPINNKEMNRKASKAFGPKYSYCWTVSHYQKHKQNDSFCLFPQNFDFEGENVKEIFEKTRDFVTKTELKVKFVVTVPLSLWSTQTEELYAFLREDRNFCFKTEYC